MKVKSVYICEICNTSHKTKSAAKTCETACINQRENSEEEKQKRANEKEKWFLAQSLSEIAQNISDYLTSKTKIECRAEFSSMVPREICSNSHTSPIGKPSNWCEKNKDLPNGYMGIVGDLKIHIKGGYSSKVSEAFDGIRYKFNIATGCGGSRDCGLGYQITVWADDYPNIRKKMDEYFDANRKCDDHAYELKQIESDYYHSTMNFVQNHETFLAQEEIVRQAQERKSEIAANLYTEFQRKNPIPEPKTEKVTHEDVRTIEQIFIN